MHADPLLVASQTLGTSWSDLSQPRRPVVCSWCLAKRSGGPENNSFGFPGKFKTLLSGKSLHSCRLSACGGAEYESQQGRRQGSAGRQPSGFSRWHLGNFARGGLPEFWDLRNWTFGSSISGNLMETWVLIWSVAHSGSTRYGEAAVPGPSLSKASSSSSSSRPVRWLQANITGACNIECMLEMKADISLLTEVRCSGKALAKECKRRNLVCTGRDNEPGAPGGGGL